MFVHSFNCFKSCQLSLSMQSKIQKWRPVLEGEVGQNWVEPSSQETESCPHHSPHASSGRSVRLVLSFLAVFTQKVMLPKLSFFWTYEVIRELAKLSL